MRGLPMCQPLTWQQNLAQQGRSIPSISRRPDATEDGRTPANMVDASRPPESSSGRINRQCYWPLASPITASTNFPSKKSITTVS